MGHENRAYELGGEEALTLPELAEIIGEEAGRGVACGQLSEEEYTNVLIDAGHPEPYARVLADSDRGIDRGELHTESGDLRRLIGRSTTSDRGYRLRCQPLTSWPPVY